jgi:hypothetical protein
VALGEEIGVSGPNKIHRRKPPWIYRPLPFPLDPFQRAREYCIMVGSVLLTSVYTCRMGKFGVEPLAASLLLHLLISSMTLESTPC